MTDPSAPHPTYSVGNTAAGVCILPQATHDITDNGIAACVHDRSDDCRKWWHRLFPQTATLSNPEVSWARAVAGRVLELMNKSYFVCRRAVVANTIGIEWNDVRTTVDLDKNEIASTVGRIDNGASIQIRAHKCSGSVQHNRSTGTSRTLNSLQALRPLRSRRPLWSLRSGITLWTDRTLRSGCALRPSGADGANRADRSGWALRACGTLRSC